MKALRMEMVELSVPFIVLMVLLASVFSKPAANPLRAGVGRAPMAMKAAR